MLNLKVLNNHLIFEINSIKEELRNLNDRVPDPNDAGNVVEQQFGLQSQLRFKISRQQSLSRAIRKQDDGDFGWCEDCGIAIPEERLMLIPDAPCCVDCQSIRELKLRVA